MWTNGGLTRILEGTVAMGTATVKVMLLDVAYVPNPDHEFIADIASHEMSGTGYVGGFAGGGRKTLAGKTFTKDDTLDEARFDATDPVWTGADFGTVGHAAIVIESGSDATSPVLGIVSLAPGGVETKGGSFTLQLATFALKLKVGV